MKEQLCCLSFYAIQVLIYLVAFHPIIRVWFYYYTSIKNNCLMKSEVGMAVLKKQTNKSSRGNQHICIVHLYTCFIYLVRDISLFVMYYIYGSVRAIPTYRVYRLYDTMYTCSLENSKVKAHPLDVYIFLVIYNVTFS